MVRLLRWLWPIVGVADRKIPDRIGASSHRRQRDRCEEKDLAPDGEQGRGKPDRGFQPLESDGRVSLKHLPRRSTFKPA
jgi:hypothetical protein